MQHDLWFKNYNLSAVVGRVLPDSACALHIHPLKQTPVLCVYVTPETYSLVLVEFAHQWLYERLTVPLYEEDKTHLPVNIYLYSRNLWEEDGTNDYELYPDGDVPLVNVPWMIALGLELPE